MITAMISTILGMLGGVLPDLTKALLQRMAAKDERALLELQAKVQLQSLQVNKDTRLAEIGHDDLLATMRAHNETLLAAMEQSKLPSGIAWVDALNAAMRPICTIGIMGLFFCCAAGFVGLVFKFAITGAIPLREAAPLIFGGLIGESFMAVWGFLWGYRSALKK